MGGEGLTEGVGNNGLMNPTLALRPGGGSNKGLMTGRGRSGQGGVNESVGVGVGNKGLMGGSEGLTGGQLNCRGAGLHGKGKG